MTNVVPKQLYIYQTFLLYWIQQGKERRKENTGHKNSTEELRPIGKLLGLKGSKPGLNLNSKRLEKSTDYVFSLVSKGGNKASFIHITKDEWLENDNMIMYSNVLLCITLQSHSISSVDLLNVIKYSVQKINIL